MSIPETRRLIRERSKVIFAQAAAKFDDLKKFHDALMNGNGITNVDAIKEFELEYVPMHMKHLATLDKEFSAYLEYKRLFDECAAKYIEVGCWTPRELTLEESYLELISDEATARGNLQVEADALRKLANVGLALEIGGHDMYYMVNDVKSLINQVSDKTLSEKLLDAFQTMTDNFNGWYEMKVSGSQFGGYVTGKEIFDFIDRKYGHHLSRDNVKFTATKSFLDMKIYASRSMMFGVFINLVANASYWVKKGSAEKKEILLSYIKDKNDNTKGIAYVSDNGNGVDPHKVDRLFTPFFTERPHGGRGIGLVMIKRNLESRNFGLSYSDNKILSGANFAVSLHGVS